MNPLRQPLNQKWDQYLGRGQFAVPASPTTLYDSDDYGGPEEDDVCVVCEEPDYDCRCEEQE